MIDMLFLEWLLIMQIIIWLLAKLYSDFTWSNIWAGLKYYFLKILPVSKWRKAEFSEEDRLD
jgi:hypothetical protein